jgi:hypothetical protein
MSEHKHSPKHLHSLDQAVGVLATQKLAAAQPADLVAQFKKQGIGSLDDLAKAIVEQAAGAVRGNAYDAEFFPVCYKFTTARPHFGEISQEDLKQLVDLVQPGLAGGGLAGGGQVGNG